MGKKLLAALISLSLIGCVQPDVKIKHPDAPLLLIQASGRARVALWDGEQLSDFGWVNLKDYEGWTLTKYDWEEHE